MTENSKQKSTTTKNDIGRPKNEGASKLNKTKIEERIGECAICKNLTEKYCSKCVQAGLIHFYCSKQCQKLDWPIHKHFCAIESIPCHWKAELSAATIKEGISLIFSGIYIHFYSSTCLGAQLSARRYGDSKAFGIRHLGECSESEKRVFLVAQHEMSRPEIGEQGLLGI